MFSVMMCSMLCSIVNTYQSQTETIRYRQEVALEMMGHYCDVSLTGGIETGTTLNLETTHTL